MSRILPLAVLVLVVGILAGHGLVARAGEQYSGPCKRRVKARLDVEGCCVLGSDQCSGTKKEYYTYFCAGECEQGKVCQQTDEDDEMLIVYREWRCDGDCSNPPSSCTETEIAYTMVRQKKCACR